MKYRLPTSFVLAVILVAGCSEPHQKQPSASQAASVNEQITWSPVTTNRIDKTILAAIRNRHMDLYPLYLEILLPHADQAPSFEEMLSRTKLTMSNNTVIAEFWVERRTPSEVDRTTWVTELKKEKGEWQETSSGHRGESSSIVTDVFPPIN
jgi:hypothetical protein